MSFFKNFPTIQYDLFETGELIDIKNIFKQVDVNDLLIEPSLEYTYYDIGSGERPDTVSQRLYGTTDYYWTFFILNDSLKEGIRAWPKSEQELERYIAKTHDSYGALIIPQQYGNSSKSTLAGLDMSHPYLRVRRDNIQNAYALVDSYDPSKYQLNVHSVSNPERFWDSGSQLRLEVYNPYNPSSDPTNYNAAEAENIEWIASTYDWARETQFEVFDFFHTNFNTEGYSLETSRTNLLLAWYDFAFGGNTPSFLYADSHTYRLGRNAPHQYFDDEGNLITAYDALVGEGGIGAIYFNTVVEHEREQNFAKRKIRVIKKDTIGEFIEEFRNLLNS